CEASGIHPKLRRAATRTRTDRGNFRWLGKVLVRRGRFLFNSFRFWFQLQVAKLNFTDRRYVGIRGYIFEVLIFPVKIADHLPNLDNVARFRPRWRNPQNAAVHSFNLLRCLFALHGKERVAALHAFALFLQPTYEVGFFHGPAQPGNRDLYWHVISGADYSRTRSRIACAIASTSGTTAFSSDGL